MSDFKINTNLLENAWKVEERKFKYFHSSVIITIDTSGNFRSIVLFLNRNLAVVVVYLVAWVRSRDETTVARFPLGAEGHQPPWGKMTSWSLPSFPPSLSCQGASLTIRDLAQLEGKSYRHHIYNLQKGLLFYFLCIDFTYLAPLGLSCSTKDLSCSKTFSRGMQAFSCGICTVPDRGSNPGLLLWKGGILTSRAPGKSLGGASPLKQSRLSTSVPRAPAQPVWACVSVRVGDMNTTWGSQWLLAAGISSLQGLQVSRSSIPGSTVWVRSRQFHKPLTVLRPAATCETLSSWWRASVLKKPWKNTLPPLRPSVPMDPHSVHPPTFCWPKQVTWPKRA